MKIDRYLALAAVSTGIFCAVAAQQPPPPAGPQQPPAANYQYFFTEASKAFEASMDKADMKTDSDGNHLISVRLTNFSPAFRGWILNNFPGAETATYALDSYSIDCEEKRVGEHQIIWYDANGGELSDFDFGGIMSAPIAYSMKDNLMKKVCGLG